MQKIIGESDRLSEALSHASRVAPLNRPILVIGERGSGKELIAERLHYLSTRWEAPFSKVNCAAMSEELLDSELFGHEAGAFTGATKSHVGRFERLDTGTLFLDELGTLPARTQEKLLRVIEYGEFERLGGQRTLKVDVRIIGATNANLPKLASTGKFRHDLLDRLAFDVIHVPALRERLEDIPILTEYFANRMSIELEREHITRFSKNAMDTLLTYSWPGNIRELKNVVERSVCHWQEPDEIDEVIIDPFTQKTSTQEKNNTKHAEIKLKQSEIPPAALPFTDAVKQFEISKLKHALAHCQHHQRKSAEHLGLSYHQLRALLKKYKHELTL